jgi:hypothetical protein
MNGAWRAAGPALGIVLSAVLFLNTRALDDVARDPQLGPGFWPRLVLAGLALACGAKLGEEWRRRRWRAKPGHGRVEPASTVDGRREVSGRRLAAAVAAIVLYVLVTPTTGFALATAAFIVAFMWLAGARSTSLLAGSAVLGTVGLLYLFVKLVYLPLPKGDGPLEAVTLGLYRLLRIF